MEFSARLTAMGSLLDDLDAVLWEYLPGEGRFTLVTGGAGLLTAAERERCQAEPGFWPSLLHPGDRARVLAAQAEAVRAGTGYALDYRIVTGSGDVHWVHEVAKVLPGVPVRLFGLMVDRTAQTEAEQARAALEADVISGLERSPDFAIAFQDGLVVYANEAAGVILQATPESLIGRARSELVAAEDRERVEEGVAQVTEGQRVHATAPVGLRRADGTTVHLELHASPIPWGGRRAELAVGRGLTLQADLERRLVRADRLVSLGLLTASVAHELSNPISAILTNLFLTDDVLDSLGRSPAVVELRILLIDVKAAAERARALVADLKQLGRPGDEVRTEVDLGTLLSVALRLSRPALLMRCQLDVTYASSPRVLANEGRLLQVLLNLLTNAIQALPPGEASTNRVRASVGTDAEGNAQVEVSDSGPGVALELWERIFEPFFTTKPNGVGTGLGLYITRRIVEGVGGRIAVLSSEQGGARFVVTFPPAPAAAEVASPAAG